jgi:hypothetical protein
MSALTQQQRDLILSYFGSKPKRRRRQRPMKLVCLDGRVVADADVIVSPSDPNWYRHTFDGGLPPNGVVQIRLDRRP